MQSRSRGRRRARRNPAWVSDTAPCGCLWLGSIWALSSLHPPSGAFRPWSFTLLSLTLALPASGQASSQPDQMSKHSVCHQPVLRMSMVHVHISWRGWGANADSKAISQAWQRFRLSNSLSGPPKLLVPGPHFEQLGCIIFNSLQLTCPRILSLHPHRNSWRNPHFAHEETEA